MKHEERITNPIQKAENCGLEGRQDVQRRAAVLGAVGLFLDVRELDHENLVNSESVRRPPSATD